MTTAVDFPRPLRAPLTPEGLLHPDVWGDLPGQVRPCFELVREVLGRLGVRVIGLSVEAADAWRDVDGEPAPGDVALAVADGVQHVGVCLGAGKVLHATGISRRVAVGSLASWRRSGVLRGFLRHGGVVAAEPLPEARGGSVRVVHLPDMRDPSRRDHVVHGSAAGLSLKGVAPEGANVVLTADGPRRLDEVHDRPLVPGDTVVFATVPGEEILISLAIGLLFSGLSLLLAPAIPKPTSAREESSPGYDLSGLRNTTRVGIPEPIAYGEVTVGGNLISVFQRIGEDGRSTLFILQLLSVGPIQSIAGLTADADELQGADIPDGLKIDGNAASAYDCAVSVRLGGANQLPIPGFYETVNEFPQTPTLQEETPFHYETTQAVDGFAVQITFPTGLVDVTSSGAFASRRVVFTVRWRPVGSSTWSTYTWTVIDARQTAFSRQFEKLGLARDRYEIQVERADGDGIISAPWPESAPKFYSQSVLSAVREIVAGARSHPGKALVGWRIRQTEQLGLAVPRVTAAIEGRKMWVWDGVSTATPNFGSDEVYTRTPAWCILDLLLNPRYGGGRSGRQTLDNVDLEDLYAFAEANDYAVSDGRGGTAPRAVLNILIDTQRPLWEIVVEIAAAAWGRLYQAGNKARVILDAFGAGGPPTVPEFVFGLGNSRDVKFSHYGRVRRPNVVEVGFFNDETNFEADAYPSEDEASIVDRGEPVVSETTQAPGCTRPYQAARLATFRRLFHQLVDRGVSLVSGPESLALLPGAVVSVHGAGMHDGYSGRLIAATSTSVTLDRDIVVSASSPARARIWLKRQATDAITTTAYVAAGTYARGTPITVVDSAGGATTITASAGDVWAIEDPTGSGRGRLHRVAKIRTDRDGTRYFEAHKYDVGMFDDDPGEVPEFTDELPNVKAIPAAPSVTARSLEYASCDGGVVDGILVEFQCPERWQYGEVWYRALGGAQDDGAVAWRFAGWARGAYQIAPLAGCTNYEVAVVGVAPGGARQRIEHAARAMVFLRGRRDPPLAPTSLKAEVVAGMLHVTIGRPADATIAGFEVVYGDHFAGSVRLALRAGDELLVPCPFVGTQTIRAKSVSRTGFHSLDEVTASVTAHVAESIYTRDVNSNSHTGWAGTKTNTAVTGSELQLSGSNLSGTYQTPDYSTAITKEVQELRITLKGEIARTAATWDECVHRWADSSWTWSTWYLRGDEIEAAQRLPTWDHWGFSWDSMIGALLTWSGGVDVFAGLTPTIEYDVDTGSGFSGTWTEYKGPVSIANLAGVRVRVTMRRPHSRYDPRLVELNVSTLALAESEPAKESHAFWNNTATAVSARTVGIGTTTGTDAALVVPTGKKLKILRVDATVKTGATAGSYKVTIVLRNVTDASDTTLFEVTGTEGLNLRGNASGTRAAPVAELAAGKTWFLGWVNHATSIGALANVFHHVHVQYCLEDV